MGAPDTAAADWARKQQHHHAQFTFQQTFKLKILKENVNEYIVYSQKLQDVD